MCVSAWLYENYAREREREKVRVPDRGLTYIMRGSLESIVNGLNRTKISDEQ
jgi:hypothetical protein